MLFCASTARGMDSTVVLPESVDSPSIRMGVVSGIGQHTTALDLLQAITEASFHRIARIAELLLAGENAAPKFLVSGGIQRSRASMQRLADVLGHSIYANPEPEASIRGAAVFALEKLGVPVPELRAGAAIRPRRKVAALYARERAEQVALEAFLQGRNERAGGDARAIAPARLASKK